MTMKSSKFVYYNSAFVSLEMFHEVKFLVRANQFCINNNFVTKNVDIVQMIIHTSNDVSESGHFGATKLRNIIGAGQNLRRPKSAQKKK